MSFYSQIQERINKGQKSLSVLIDPDKVKTKNIGLTVDLANANGIDFFLIGGSLLLDDVLDKTIYYLKKNSDLPVVLFPGNEMQVHPDADALLLLSLTSGRNAEYLIGKHVSYAPRIKKMNLETISTSYMLIHGSHPSTASYITQTQPIPLNKPEIAVATAMASEMLGHQMIYLEGGSGTSRPVPSQTVAKVKSAVNVPIIVGGGIRTKEKLIENYTNGADIQVIGTVTERYPESVRDLALAKREINAQLATI